MSQVKITGNHILPREAVLEGLGVKQGTNLFIVSPKEVIRQLKQNPFIQGVSVRKDLPSTVKVHVRERQPIAFINQSEPLTLAEDGTVLPGLKPLHVYDLPIITGLENLHPEIGRPIGTILGTGEPRLRWALDFLRGLRTLDVDLYYQISEINLGIPQTPIIYTTHGGVPIRMNPHSMMPMVDLLRSALDCVLRDYNLENLAYIDLRFEDQIVIKEKL
ncbi:FtsQ-type POTRA domain-containing protein [candidate division KSB1 bacterium]|nr:FtsQ-type POTRA domain-containing protein [candidate division KSB1 bacterium]